MHKISIICTVLIVLSFFIVSYLGSMSGIYSNFNFDIPENLFRTYENLNLKNDPSALFYIECMLFVMANLTILILLHASAIVIFSIFSKSIYKMKVLASAVGFLTVVSCFAFILFYQSYNGIIPGETRGISTSAGSALIAFVCFSINYFSFLGVSLLMERLND